MESLALHARRMVVKASLTASQKGWQFAAPNRTEHSRGERIRLARIRGKRLRCGNKLRVRDAVHLSEGNLQFGRNIPKERRHSTTRCLGCSGVQQTMGESLRVQLFAVRRIYSRQNQNGAVHLFHYGRYEVNNICRQVVICILQRTSRNKKGASPYASSFFLYGALMVAKTRVGRSTMYASKGAADSARQASHVAAKV
jgi:hypothetical protein